MSYDDSTIKFAHVSVASIHKLVNVHFQSKTSVIIHRAKAAVKSDTDPQDLSYLQ